MMPRKISVPTPKDRRLDTAEEMLMDVLYESMQDKVKITQLEDELANTAFEIMSMKMGGMLG